MPDEPDVYPPCPCGRDVKKLNAASDDAKCTGCGYLPELCRCLIEGVIGIGCEPDCDHAHAAEPATDLVSYLTAKVSRW